MSVALSRRKIAAYLADRIVAGDDTASLLRETAAFLVESRRDDEADLLVRDIEDALEARGTVIADVTVANDSATEYQSIVSAIHGNAKDVAVRTHVSPDIIGGIKIELPGKRYDATVRTKLDTLKQLAA